MKFYLIKTSYYVLVGIFILITSLVGLSPTYAADKKWTFVVQVGNDKIYADLGGKKRIGNMITLWILEDYKVGKQEDTKRWYSLKSENEFDCIGRVFRSIQTEAYNGSMGQGRIITARLLNSEWKSALPALYQSVCQDFLANKR